MSPGQQRELGQQLQHLGPEEPLVGAPGRLGRVLEVPGGARGGGHGELDGQVVEDAARLDDALLTVQPLVHGAQQLQDAEAALQTAQRARQGCPRPAVGHVEARLVLVGRVGQRREEVVGVKLVAPPYWRRGKRKSDGEEGRPPRLLTWFPTWTHINTDGLVTISQQR